MEFEWIWMSFTTLLASYFLYKIVRDFNGWYYGLKLGKKQYLLPPGDLGWPLFGHMFTFMRFSFFSRTPDSFLNNLISKYGRTGIYTTHLFLRPTVMVCSPELSWQVLTDDYNFKPGYPRSLQVLAPSILAEISSEEQKRFRRLVTLPIVGYNALAMYIERIDVSVVNLLEEMASKKHPVELLKELKFITLKVIVEIFIGSNNRELTHKITHVFVHVYEAVFSFPFNLPGFVYHKALKARKELDGVVISIVEERRRRMEKGEMLEKKDMVDLLLLTQDDESGRKMNDQEIIDMLVMFLFAGHESTAVMMTLATTYLARNPHIRNKAKEEQEEIVKARPASQKHLSLAEIKQMNFLNMVIDETLRKSLTFAGFRQALTDVEINGYIIPKGFCVLIWGRGSHMDGELFPNPDEFNPSRWNDYKANSRTFIPFGAGTRLCPGRDLAKLEIRIFLHHFLLNYKLEEVNPECAVNNFPATFTPKNNCLAKVIKVSGA